MTDEQKAGASPIDIPGKWISIKDRMPIVDPDLKHYSIDVLIYDPEAEPPIAMAFHNFNKGHWVINDTEPYSHSVTHWMSLPEPPK